MSTRFINECKNGANCNRLGKICVETNKIATGNNLGLSNTIDQVVSKLKIKGYTKQNSYSGKNLLKPYKNNELSYISADCYNDNNRFYIKNTFVVNPAKATAYRIYPSLASANYSSYISNVDLIDDLTPGTYTLSVRIIKCNISEDVGYIAFSYRTDNLQTNLSPKTFARINESLTNTVYSETFEVTENCPFSLFMSFNREKEITYECEFEVQLEKGNEATNYEPYVGGTPSPNPDYPQEIEVGRGSKNLFNINNYKTLRDSIGFDISKLVEGNTYTLSTNLPITAFKISTAWNGYNSVIKVSDNGFTKFTFEMKKDSHITEKQTQYAIFRIGNSVVKEISELNGYDIQLEEGNVATEYEPYNSIVCKSTGKNLFNKNNYIMGYILNYETGTLGRNGSYFTTDFIKVSPNTVYTFTNFMTYYLVCYDSDKNYIGYMERKLTTTTLENCAYIRASGRIGDVDIAQIERGSVATEYEPYKESKIAYHLGAKNIFDYTETTNTLVKNKNRYMYINTNNPIYLEAGTYTLSLPDLKLENNKYSLGVQILDTGINLKTSNNEISFTLTEPKTINRLYLYIDYNDNDNATATFTKINLIKGPISLEQYSFIADKDYIENGKLHKNIAKFVFDGSENWRGTLNYYTNVIANLVHLDDTNAIQGLSNYFKVYDFENKQLGDLYFHPNKNIQINDPDNLLYPTIDDWKNFLKEKYNSGNPVEVYYELEEEQVIDLETEGILELYSPETNLSNNIDSEMEIKYTNYETEITNSDNLSSFTVDDTCYVDGKIIGTNYIKKVQSQLVTIPNDVDLIDKNVFVKTGVKYDDLSAEWLDMGKYTIERPEDEQTANLTQITAYDDFTLLDKPYVCNLDFNNPVYVADFYSDVCKQLGLVPETTEFLNSDIQINANPFVNNESLRIVLQEIEKVSCSYGEIDLETNKIKLSWLNQSETPDYEFKTSDYTTLEGGKIIYGPVNCLVIKESQIEGENTVRQDEQSIAKDGETQIAIEDSYFLFTQALREQAIDNIWNRVKGLTYVDCKITTSYGKPFLKKGMKIRINVNDGRVFDTYVLKHTFTYDGTYQSVIESPALTKQETKIKSQSISEAIRLTQIKVDKAEGTITATAKKTQDIEDSLNNNYYSKTTVNEMIMNSETGVTNTFSEAGGNNVFRNTGSWFTETKTHTEKQARNILENMSYSYCEKNYDGPVYANRTVDYTFKVLEEQKGEFISNLNKLISIDQTGTYKYTNLSELSRYDLSILELDKDRKLIPSLIEPDVAKRIEISKYATEEEIIFNSKTKYIVLLGELNDDGAPESLEEIQEKIKDLQIIETKNVEVGEEVYEFWEGNVVRKSNDEAANNNSMLIQKGSLAQEQEVPNGNYSISFYYKKLIEQANASVLINDIEYPLDSLETKQFYTGETDNETGEYITQPIIVTSNHIKIEFKSDTNNAIEVWDLMCNKGTVKLAWSQNQNETTTETVNISKGITITSTNMETIFRANANGIKILTLQKATIAYFTDKGLSTNELIVNNKAQICGTLINEVEEQTWFTRM